MLVSLHWVGVATDPPNVTTLAPWLVPKLVPVMVTVAPTGPVAGERLVMVGGTTPVTVMYEELPVATVQTPTPPEQAQASERSQRLQKALGRLDPDSRAMLSLRFDEGMTIRQIAEVLGAGDRLFEPEREVAEFAGELLRQLRVVG